MLAQEIAPRIRSLLGNSVTQVGSDDIGELAQDGIALAARLATSCPSPRPEGQLWDRQLLCRQTPAAGPA